MAGSEAHLIVRILREWRQGRGLGSDLEPVHALVFRSSVYGNTAELDKSPRIPGRAKLAAALSLILWICVALAGRGIGYIDAHLLAAVKLTAGAELWTNDKRLRGVAVQLGVAITLARSRGS